MDRSWGGREAFLVHEYRRFVQGELDARGWKQAELVKRSGLSRQLVSKLLSDNRPYLGQMPEESTLEGIARGFSMSVERVRFAAARSLAGYEDDGHPIATDLSHVDIDALLGEVRRRVLGSRPDQLEDWPPPHLRRDDPWVSEHVPRTQQG
jgi:transcriptional regulator with XRE-family HTH domain